MLSWLFSKQQQQQQKPVGIYNTPPTHQQIKKRSIVIICLTRILIRNTLKQKRYTFRVQLCNYLLSLFSQESTIKFPRDNELTQRAYNSLRIQYSKTKGKKYSKQLILDSSVGAYCAFRRKSTCPGLQKA